jgi:MCM N-terminal domain
MAAYLDEPNAPDEALDGRARPYQEFLEDNTFNYQDDIVRMLNLDQTRLIVDLDHLRAYRKELATAWVFIYFILGLSNNTQNPQRTFGPHSSL